MLDAVIRFSLRHRPLVLTVSLVALCYGAYVATTLSIDVFPDLDRPRVVILTECPGLAPEEIESLVTQPVESAILGATGVEAVRSHSSMGLAVIYVEFAWTTEVRAARQVVQERLATVMPLMPPGIRPVMTPPTSIMGQIMHVGLYRQRGPNGGVLAALGANLVAERLPRDEQAVAVWNVVDRADPATWTRVPVERVAWHAATSPGGEGEATESSVTIDTDQGALDATFASPLAAQMELRTLCDWVVRPRLLKVRGIAEVLLLGGERKQYQVLVDPGALLEFDVTLADVERALDDNNLNASGGFTIEGQTERPIRVIGRVGPRPEKVLADLRQVPVKTDAVRSVLFGQVATIVEAPRPKRGDASIDGSPGVVITVVKQPHVDTRGVSERVHAALRDVEAALPADIAVNQQLFELKSFIDRGGIYYVVEALLVGALLVIVILVMFLWNLRITFITLTAIPLSLALTALVFKWLGVVTGWEMSINVMTLGGLAVAMGELVDDAIVDVENIYRRLRENAVLATPRPMLRVVFEASREIRSAIVFGTAIVILVFLPLFALSGVEGRLFTPLGIAYITSILASLLVSLTVTPVLSSYLLAKPGAQRHGDAALLRGLKRLAGSLIRFSMRHAGAVLAAAWLAVLASAWTLTQLGADFLPSFDEGSIQLNVALPAGSSLEASNDVAAIIDATLSRMRKSPVNPQGPILHFVRRTGRDERDEHSQAVTHSEYLLSMNPLARESRDEAIGDLLDRLHRELPGIDLEAEQPLVHLISHMLSGVSAQVAIKVFGDDLDALQRIAREIKAEIADVPGLVEPVIESQSYADELHIVLRPADLALYGVSRAEVSRALQTALLGQTVSQVLDGQRRFDLVVKLQENFRTDYENLANLRIDLPEGRGQIALGQVADLLGTAAGPNEVNRDDVRRRLVIRCNALGRDLAGVVDDIEQRVRERVDLPAGYFVEYGGQFESQRSATLLVGLLAIVSMVGVFAVLLVLWPSVPIVLQVLNAIPTAFVGGVAALVLTGQSLTVASLVGFVSLGGIAVRNGILLVSHYFHLMREEGEHFSEPMILRGSLERLSPVLMTALTAGFALLPIVLGGQKPGLEILYPVATVIVGGLVTSTFCEFLIHPGLFWKFSGGDAKRLAHQDHGQDVLAPQPAEPVTAAASQVP